MTDKSGRYEALANEVGKLVGEKNKQYGGSFEKAGAFLKLLYPTGIPVESFTDALCVVRIFDKLSRIGNASNLPLTEGKLDAWRDIIGYGLLGLEKDQPIEQPEAKEDKNLTALVVKHKGFTLDKSALEDALNQPLPAIPTILEELGGVNDIIQELNRQEEVEAELAQDPDIINVETKLRDQRMAAHQLKAELVRHREACGLIAMESGFEDFMKDIAAADAPRRAQVKAFWDKLEAEQDAKKEVLRQKEVSADIIKEIEKDKLQCHASQFVEGITTGFDKPYNATETVRLAIFQQLKNEPEISGETLNDLPAKS